MPAVSAFSRSFNQHCANTSTCTFLMFALMIAVFGASGCDSTKTVKRPRGNSLKNIVKVADEG